MLWPMPLPTYSVHDARSDPPCDLCGWKPPSLSMYGELPTCFLREISWPQHSPEYCIDMQEKTRLQREHLAMFGEDEDTKSPRGHDTARTRMGTQRRALIEARERADRLERERRDMEANDRNVDKIWEENETRAMSEQDTDILISEAELDALIV